MSKDSWDNAFTITPGTASESTPYDGFMLGQPEQTVTYQHAEAQATDTMFHSGLTSTDFSTNSLLLVGNQEGTRTRTLMSWDFTHLTQGIPLHSEITEATLTLLEETDEMDSEQTIQVLKVENTAVTEVATWATYDGSNAWATAGGDWKAGAVASVTTSGGNLVINDADFVAFIQDSMDNAGRVARFILATTYELGGGASGNQRIQFRSSSDSASGKRPKLVIKYIPGEVKASYYNTAGQSSRGGVSLRTFRTNVVYPIPNYGFDSYGIPAGTVPIGFRA
jgi:hypothetical protein